jgi:hypothetical protein
VLPGEGGVRLHPGAAWLRRIRRRLLHAGDRRPSADAAQGGSPDERYGHETRPGAQDLRQNPAAEKRHCRHNLGRGQ